MNKILIISIMLFFILLTSIVVFAAGTSTVPIDPTRDTTAVDDNSDESAADTTNSDIDDVVPSTSDGRQYRKIQGTVKDRLIEARERIQQSAENDDCESLETRAERIACRLKVNKDRQDYDDVDYEKRVPEACRSLKNPTACIALYKNVRDRGCYVLEGRHKDRCLKITAGITKARLSEIPREERVQKTRDYMVLLLYELQERIEHANEEGNITDEDSAEIIDLVVEIKQNILDGEKRDVILPKMNDLKQKIRVFRSGDSTE